MDSGIACVCPLCNNLEESISNKYWDCKQAQWAWNYTHGILNCLFYGSSFMQQVMPMQSRHIIFVAKEPRHLCNVINLWSLLKGITLWIVWITKMISTMEGGICTRFKRQFGKLCFIMTKFAWNRCARLLDYFLMMNKNIFIILTKCGVDIKWYALGQGTLLDGVLMGLEGASLVNVWGWMHVGQKMINWVNDFWPSLLFNFPFTLALGLVSSLNNPQISKMKSHENMPLNPWKPS
jgi:hypothetical protein